MKEAERISALQNLGYTEREGSFLALAALHGGYFLRRQFETFADLKRGRASSDFLRKTVQAGHARVNVYSNRTEVYHLFARTLYHALGDEDNRNRRDRPPLSIKAKLMALDCVLAHRPHLYLATEQDKFVYFTVKLGIDASKLPGKIYRSAVGDLQTRRCFIEKYPLFLSNRTSFPSVVSFCYVDEGALSTTGFESFLRRYQRLFVALRRFRLVYVAADWVHLRSAELRFLRFVEGLSSPERCRPKGILGEYFRLRYLVDTSQWRLLDVAALDRLRALTKRFQNPVADSKFQDWKEVIEASQHAPLLEANFEFVRLPYNYAIFGTTREPAKQENSEHRIATGVPLKASGQNGPPDAKPLRSQRMNTRRGGDRAGRRDAGWAGATPAFVRLLRPKTSLRSQACFEGRSRPACIGGQPRLRPSSRFGFFRDGGSTSNSCRRCTHRAALRVRKWYTPMRAHRMHAANAVSARTHYPHSKKGDSNPCPSLTDNPSVPRKRR